MNATPGPSALHTMSRRNCCYSGRLARGHVPQYVQVRLRREIVPGQGD